MQLLFDHLENEKPELVLKLCFDKHKVSFEQNEMDSGVQLRRNVSMINNFENKINLPPIMSRMNSYQGDNLEEFDISPEDDQRDRNQLQDLRKPRRVFNI